MLTAHLFLVLLVLGAAEERPQATAARRLRAALALRLHVAESHIRSRHHTHKMQSTPCYKDDSWVVFIDAVPLRDALVSVAEL